jgi:ParB/RepB/Spo0J family partition protein
MLIELSDLELRYAPLRIRDAARAARMRASLAAHGQQSPVSVIAHGADDAKHFVLIDGYLRVLAARLLAQDVIEAMVLPLAEADALIMAHRLEEIGRRSALEDGWLLEDLIQRHGLSQQELSKRLSRSHSSVSRRLSLVYLLPELAQSAVRDGFVPAQAAMKYLVPLSRDKREGCARIVQHLDFGPEPGAVFAQVYWRFSRLECRAFLSDAAQFFGGCARRCMTDNTSVVIAHGTGKDAVPAETMRVFGERFGFYFEAHAVGDANRSARVERRFHYIENNFYPGRTFVDLADVNSQLRQWCIAVNDKARRSLPRTPAELLAAERGALQPLPIHVPEVYEPHRRRVGVEGYISIHTNRYPVADLLIGRHLDVHETVSCVRILDGHRLIAQYDKLEPGRNLRVPVPRGLHRRGLRPRLRPASPHEQVLRALDPALSTLVDALKKREGGQALRSMRRLHRMYIDYPTAALVQVVRDVERFGLIDLSRIEKLVLEHLRGEFFRLPHPDDSEDTS